MDKDKTEIQSIDFSDFTGIQNRSTKINMKDDIQRLADLKLNVRAVLGKKITSVGEIGEYKLGDIVEVDRIAGHTVDIYVGLQKIALGEIILMDDNNFGLMVSHVLDEKGEFLKNVRKNGDVS
jgi:flagellar motor switch/type III secretory pathway protein FliN